MTLDQIIALAASSAAALSAVATFLTVRQISKQRQASYRPDLVFASKLFTVIRREGTNEGPPTHWTSPNEALTAASRNFTLRLLNIGMGAARDVTIAWDFDVEATVSSVNHLAQKSLGGTFIEYNNGALTIRSTEGLRATSIWENQRSSRLDYVLPERAGAAGTEVNLPNAYVTLLALYVYFAAKSDSNDKLDETPRLSVTLHCEDIGGQKVSRFFDIHADVVAVIGSGEQFQGQFTVQRKQPQVLISKELVAGVVEAALTGTGASLGLGRR